MGAREVSAARRLTFHRMATGSMYASVAVLVMAAALFVYHAAEGDTYDNAPVSLGIVALTLAVYALWFERHAASDLGLVVPTDYEVGQWVRIWRGDRSGPSVMAQVAGYAREMGGTAVLPVRWDQGRTDHIALTHVAPLCHGTILVP